MKVSKSGNEFFMATLLSVGFFRPLAFLGMLISIQPAQAADLLEHQAAFGDYSSDAPGVRRTIRIEDLPKTNATPSADKPPHTIKRPEGAMPKAPLGFTVDLLAGGLSGPRKIVAAPNGDIWIAESSAGRIKVLQMEQNNKASPGKTFAEKLHQPFGIAFYPPNGKPTHVYIANTDSVVRYPYQDGDSEAKGPGETIVPDIPGGGKLRGGGHWTRDVAFSPDGKKMFVSVGSHSDRGEEDEALDKRRADILEYNPDGSGFQIYATGIRNPVGLAFEPKTRAMWTSVNERDGLGDDLPPDYITHVERDGFYGWPWYFIGNHEDPKWAGKHPELATKVIVPDVLVQAHSAALCLAFYTGSQFPKEFHGCAFVAFHGSWNRAKRTGYKVVAVPFKNGKTTGEYVDFLTGFVSEDGNVWGRPVGVAMDREGSLLVSDDAGNCLWRVRYTDDKTGKS
jgi:glucose/arabinose dehydrogenase